MNYKDIKKISGRWVARIMLKSCFFINRFTPESFFYAIANFVAKVGYCLISRHRRNALEGLKIAFGVEKSRQEMERIAKDSIQDMVKSGMEVVFFAGHQNLIKGRVKIEGKEHLDKALLEGKGVMIVSGHFGNFPLMLMKLAQEGYKINSLIRPMRDQKLDKYLLKKRTEVKVATIFSSPRKECIEGILKALRENELVFIPMDQNFGTGGIFVDFFGMKAATATGPVVFARRTKAAILPMFIVRDKKDNSLKIIIEAPVCIEESKDSKEVTQKTVQKITDIIEGYIRRYPEQWGWIHRRWKSRPSQ